MESNAVKDYAQAAAIVLAAIAVFAILKKTGLLGISEEKKQAEALKKLPEFREDGAKKIIEKKKAAGMSADAIQKKYSLPSSQFSRLALQISSAHKPFNWQELLKLATPITWPLVDVDDDEQKVYGAFGKLETTLDLALLSFSFNRLYKVRLINFLAEWMNNGELAEVYKIVKELKKV